MSDKINEIFASVLRMPPESINDDVSPGNTPRWDSLQSINLVLALEEEFGIVLGTKDIKEMQSVGLVKSVLRSKGVPGI